MNAETEQTPLPQAERPPGRYALFDAGVETHRLLRRLVETTDGRNWQIFTAVPVGAPPRAGYPALYMLDGNAAFDTLTPEHLEAAPDLVVIGIGYETPLRFDVRQRVLDFTPSRDGGGPVPDPERPGREIGGADDFLDCLCGELRIEAERELPIDADRRAIWGHSLAGLFVLYALLSRPAAFARYVAASPSIWWGDEWLLSFEARASLPADFSAHVLVMLGDSEKRSSPSGPHWDGPAPHTLAMIERLRRRPQLDVFSDVFAGLGHAAMQAASLQPALAFASGHPNR